MLGEKSHLKLPILLKQEHILLAEASSSACPTIDLHNYYRQIYSLHSVFGTGPASD